MTHIPVSLIRETFPVGPCSVSRACSEPIP